MQIHELTKRQKTNEGILDGLKAAVNVAKTGADSFASHMVPGYDTAKAGIQAAKTGYKQGGMKGLGAALVSPSALAQAQGQQLQKQSQKGLQDLKAKGINAKQPLTFYINQLKNPTDPEFKDDADTAKQQRQALDTQFTQEFDVGPVLPDDANHVLTVKLQSAGQKYPTEYYKDINGKWYQESQSDYGGTKASPITSPGAIQKLEDLIDNDQYSQISISMAHGLAPSQQPAVKGKAKSVPATQPAEKTPQQTQGQPAQTTMAEAAPMRQAGQLAQRAAQRNAPVKTTQAAQATPGQKTKRPSGKKKLRTDFNDWIAQKVPGYGNIINDADVDKALKSLFNKLLASKNDPKTAAQIFDQYVLTIQAGILRAKKGGQGDQTAGEQPADQTGDQLAQLRGQPAKKTGNPELDNILTQAGIKLSETEQKLKQELQLFLNEDATLRGFPPLAKKYLDNSLGDESGSIYLDTWVFLDFSIRDQINKIKDPSGDAHETGGLQLDAIMDIYKTDPNIKRLVQQREDARQNGLLDHEDDTEEYTTPKTSQQVRKRGVPKNAKVDKMLANIDLDLNESQVYITKDIVVKTSKGDYVKRHTDQEWYDPNGVRIDPEKYPEYIAKLDATPVAQTRYQADSEKRTGSVTGVKAQQVAAREKVRQQPKIELPKATAADWEEYKAQQNRLNNQAIDKTVNDLRNAEYFNTDQQQYLQQQLAQLMAKKF